VFYAFFVVNPSEIEGILLASRKSPLL
jgi:hypothetical protein